MTKNYVTTPISRNWNRMAELSRLPKRNRIQEAEYSYRQAVQNHFSSHGVMPHDYVPVGETPK